MLYGCSFWSNVGIAKGILCANKNVENKAKLSKQVEYFQVFLILHPLPPPFLVNFNF